MSATGIHVPPISVPQVRPDERNEIGWLAEGSVWSIVCAMELGLLTESSLKNISFVPTPHDYTTAKVHTAESKKFGRVGPTVQTLCWPYTTVRRQHLGPTSHARQRPMKGKRRSSKLTMPERRSQHPSHQRGEKSARTEHDSRIRADSNFAHASGRNNITFDRAYKSYPRRKESKEYPRRRKVVLNDACNEDESSSYVKKFSKRVRAGRNAPPNLKETITSRIIESIKLNAPEILRSCEESGRKRTNRSAPRFSARKSKKHILLEIDRENVRSLPLDDCLARMQINVTLNVVGDYPAPDVTSTKVEIDGAPANNRKAEFSEDCRKLRSRVKREQLSDCEQKKQKRDVVDALLVFNSLADNGPVPENKENYYEDKDAEDSGNKRATRSSLTVNGKDQPNTDPDQSGARGRDKPARSERYKKEESGKSDAKRSPSLEKKKTTVARNTETKANSPEKDEPCPGSESQSKSSNKEDEFQDVRRMTRGLTKVSKENFVGKLVWGFCSGWWPALIIDAAHVGMLSEPGKLWVYWIGEARISLLNERTQIECFSCNLESRLTQNANAQRARAIDATIQMLRKRFDFILTKPYHAWIVNNFTGLNPSIDEVKFYPYPSNVQRRLDQLKERNAKTTERYLLEQKQSTSQPKRPTEKSKESAQQSEEDLARLPLKEQNPGAIVWAKIAGHNWWPAMIIDYRDCCMREPNFGCQWIMWYGDYQLSQIHHHAFLRFEKGVEKMREYVHKTNKHVYLIGVLQAAKDYCLRLGVEVNNWSLSDVFKYFSKFDKTIESAVRPRDSTKIYDKYSEHIVEKLQELNNNPNIDDQRQGDIQQSDDFRLVRDGKCSIETLCLKCLKVFNEEMENHPFFHGSLCKECSEQFKPRMFLFGNDGKCFYCTICGWTGTVVICDKEDCPRVYCTACLKYLLCPKAYEDMLLEDPWECFLCKNQSSLYADLLVKPRLDWKEKIIDIFRTRSNPKSAITLESNAKKKKIRVLSLFDGLSTGLLVLLKLGIVVDVYYASEIDADALMVSNCHFGDRVIHLGDVRYIAKETIEKIAPIDLLIGGSPCNDLSLANPARLGLHNPQGTGVLFFDYCRIRELVIEANKGHRLFWFYENVASMPSEYRLEMNKHLGQEPDVIDSADFSPQHRLRLYWHNLPMEPHSLCFQGEQDVQDILTPHCQRYALVKKIRTVTTKVNSLKQGKLALKPILMKDESDSIWITELEEIFGFPRHYTDVKNLSATKRQRLIGKSWSVQTLTAILRCLCPFFQCNLDSKD